MIGSIECFYSICFTLGELLKLAGTYLYIYQYVWALRKCEWHPTPVLFPLCLPEGFLTHICSPGLAPRNLGVLGSHSLTEDCCPLHFSGPDLILSFKN